MDTSIITAVIVGVLALISNVITSKFVSNVRVVKLEMKVDTLEETVHKHNQLVERMYCVENKVRILEHDLHGKKVSGRN